MTHEYAVINVQKNGEFKVLTIDTNKARYFNAPWKTLGDRGKRKFENLLVLRSSQDRLKIFYV